ncbi:MAG: hypothetical protein Q4G65_02515 [bacterium]|nr:hypothetical protein [bacterium]
MGYSDIESANIVGYTQKDAAQGKFLIIGAGFEAVQGGTAINDIVSGVQGVDYGDGIEFVNLAAQIQIPSALGYNTYYFLNDGWFDDGSEEGDVKAGWCDSVGNIVDAEIVPGVAAWFKSVPSDGFATVAGEVPADVSKSVACPEGFALRANAFPAEIPLNGDKMTSADIVGVDYGDGIDFVNTAAQIQVPSALGYNTYYYLNDGWYDDGSEEGATKAGWCDSVGNLVDAVIPAGQGFWTKGTSGAFTLTFTK